MAGFGTTIYGGGSYGLAGSGAPQLYLARPIAAKAVRAYFTSPVQALSAAKRGDALNPKSWVLTNTSTGQVLTVIGVQSVQPIEFDLYTLEPIGTYFDTLVVDASAINGPAGVPLTPGQVYSTFGLQAQTQSTKALKEAQRGFRPRDLANAPTPLAGLNGGALVVLSGGDYALQEGDSLLKKLIFRRLTTQPGAFYHLPNYGFGLSPKALVKPAQLPAIRRQMEDAIKLEPEVAAARVGLSLTSDGVMQVQITVQTTRQENLVFGFKLPSGAPSV